MRMPSGSTSGLCESKIDLMRFEPHHYTKMRSLPIKGFVESRKKIKQLSTNGKIFLFSDLSKFLFSAIHERWSLQIGHLPNLYTTSENA